MRRLPAGAHTQRRRRAGLAAYEEAREEARAASTIRLRWEARSLGKRVSPDPATLARRRAFHDELRARGMEIPR